MNQAQETFLCKACGHRFVAARAVVAKQPTCPKCRTFGQITPENSRPAPRPARRPGARAPASARRNDDYVEVRADVAYGKRSDTKAILNLVMLLVLGVGIIGTLYFIVTNVQQGYDEQATREREVVLDEAAFEEAIDEALDGAELALNRPEGVEVIEDGNVEEAVSAIRNTGAVSPTWTAPPRPGEPIRSKTYVARHNHNGFEMKGFVVLLYYRNLEEVNQAHRELRQHISRDMTHYGITVRQSLWYVAYMGVTHGGPLKGALSQAMASGAPTSFKQFTDRMGSTARD